MEKGMSALDKLPLSQQAVIVLQLFEAARTRSDYLVAAKRWGGIRSQLEQYETGLACDEAANSEYRIAKEAFSDLMSAPVELVVSLAELALEMAKGDQDPVFLTLKKAFEEVQDHLKDKASDKLSDAAKKVARKPLDRALASLREALLQYLQSVSKRSRKHFQKVISAAFGTLTSLGGAVALVAKTALVPSRIAPEWCGLLQDIDKAERNAFNKIYKPLLPNQPFADAAVPRIH